jgi:hypothetical protein
VSYLHATPTRLAILAAVRDGLVVGDACHWWHRDGRKVTAAIAAMQAAGWIEPATPPPADRVTARLTETGRTVLIRNGMGGDAR